MAFGVFDFPIYVFMRFLPDGEIIIRNNIRPFRLPNHRCQKL